MDCRMVRLPDSTTEKQVMATPTTVTNGPAKPKSGIKRQNKPRSFYMAYKGTLDGDPLFVFDKDDLVDKMLEDRDLQVKRITVPVGKRRKDTATPAA
jgi:hypothetical protein